MRSSALILLKAELGLGTRRTRQIKNEINLEPAPEGAKLQIQAHITHYKNARHRADVGPCRTYNCHGLTFGARRTWIDSPPEIQKILDDDDYELVSNVHNVLPGDIAIYRSIQGDIDHSGIVISNEQIVGPRILSKWAMCHEVIHMARDCPYNESTVTYYRIRR